MNAEEGTSVTGPSVTGSGSTAVCCPFARRWSAGHLCPLHCCRETRRAQICLLSASATQCGRFLQKEKSKIQKNKVSVQNLTWKISYLFSLFNYLCSLNRKFRRLLYFARRRHCGHTCFDLAQIAVTDALPYATLPFIWAWDKP